MKTYDLVRAAAITGDHPETLRQKFKAGRIKAFKSGRKWMVTEQSLAEHITTRENESLQEAQAERSKKCLSTCETAYGTSILSHQAVSELDALLRRPTNLQRKSFTIN